MDDNSRGCLKSFLVAIFIILLVICAYQSITTQFEVHNIALSISIDESLEALGGHASQDLSTQNMEMKIFQQKQTMWNIIFAVTFCALIITLIVLKKPSHSKTVEHIQTSPDAGSRLEALNKLMTDKLISQEEYDEKKKEIIKNI